MLRMSSEKKLLIHWNAWFYLGHVLLFWLIGLNYFFAIPSLDLSHWMDDFVLLSFIGHLAVLAFWPSVFMMCLIFLIPNRYFIFVVASFTTAIISSLLVFDTIVYNLYHYHINQAVMSLAYYGITEGMLGLSFREKFIPVFIMLVFIGLELLYAKVLWHVVKNKDILKGWAKHIVVLFALLIYTSYVMIVINMNPVWLRNYIERTRFLPFYVNALSMLMPKQKESLALIRIDNKDPLKILDSNRLLYYPKKPLQFHLTGRPKNLVIIGVDSWRFDMLNEAVMPYVTSFTKKAWIFNHHISGGNSTGPGVFSLFYGLPANYMTAMEIQHKGPVLINALKQHQYQMGVFSSAPLSMPPMNRSVFRDISELENKAIVAGTVFKRDQLVVEQFSDFVKKRDFNKPFFSFLFFDAAHSYCGTDEIPGPFQPTITRCNRLTFTKKRDHDTYLNRYKNALLSVDRRINETITVLEANHLLENTVIMIVGDHGEEFDDNDKGFYGHASNFGHYQVQTPLILYWPREQPQVFTYATSHLDIVPTLMTKLLGCLNEPRDYALGESLLDKKPRLSFVISSYVDFGVIEPDRITTIYSAGNYHIENPNGAVMHDSMLNLAVMKKVFIDLNYFYHE